MADTLTDLDLRERIARIDQLQADAAGKRQEMRIAPWALVVTGLTAGAGLIGAGAAIGIFAARTPQQITVHLDAPIVAPR
jgi:hypothetical protein